MSIHLLIQDLDFEYETAEELYSIENTETLGSPLLGRTLILACGLHSYWFFTTISSVMEVDPSNLSDNVLTKTKESTSNSVTRKRRLITFAFGCGWFCYKLGSLETIRPPIDPERQYPELANADPEVQADIDNRNPSFRPWLGFLLERLVEAFILFTVGH